MKHVAGPRFARDTARVPRSGVPGASGNWERQLGDWGTDLPEILGSSREGRRIAGRTFAGGATATVLVIGATHGDEPASAGAVWELTQRLPVGPAESGGAAEVLVIPVLNPDGLVAGTKNSAADVDLNRNFPARNFARAHAPGYDPGPFPLSEPETALLARLVDERGVGAVVSVHAPFACVNFDGPALRWAQAVSRACGWPVRADIGYPTPGSLGSWLGGDRGLPVLTLELPPGPLDGFRSEAARALDVAVAWARRGGGAPAEEAEERGR